MFPGRQFSVDLFPYLAQRRPAGVGGRDELKEEMLEKIFMMHLGMGSEKKGRTQHVFCCRTGNGTGELDLEEQKEKQRYAVSLPVSLAGVAFGLTGPAVVGCWDKATSQGRQVRRGISVISTEDRDRGQGRIQEAFCCRVWLDW